MVLSHYLPLFTPENEYGWSELCDLSTQNLYSDWFTTTTTWLSPPSPSFQNMASSFASLDSDSSSLIYVLLSPKLVTRLGLTCKGLLVATSSDSIWSVMLTTKFSPAWEELWELAVLHVPSLQPNDSVPLPRQSVYYRLCLYKGDFETCARYIPPPQRQHLNSLIH